MICNLHRCDREVIVKKKSNGRTISPSMWLFSQVQKKVLHLTIPYLSNPFSRVGCDTGVMKTGQEILSSNLLFN